ncbi:trans-aconitate 2-methyltransferase [soil metagenome]
MLARIPLDSPALVVDAGCGPANSTTLLRDRWPAADITGIDSSPEMVFAARRALPGAHFEVADLLEWIPPEPVDVVFSNAVLQWVEDHQSVLDHLLGWLRPGGVLAVQMPANYDKPSHTIMRELAASDRWSAQLRGILRASPVAAAEEYFRLLSGSGRSVDVWTTEYLHVLDGESPVVDWVSGTGLRPLTDALGNDDRAVFLAEYAAAVDDAYPREPDGTTLFAFQRRFVVVTTP